MEHAGSPKGLGQSLKETIDEIRSWEGKLSQLCIVEIDGKVVVELSYRIKGDGAAYPGWKICDFDYQNQGYGPQIIKLLFAFLFTDEDINSKFPIDRIIWDTMLENKRAQYVYEYPFAGYKDVLNTIYNIVHKREKARILDIGFGTGILTKKLY